MERGLELQDSLVSVIETFYDCVDGNFDYSRALASFSGATGDAGLVLGKIKLFHDGVISIDSHNIPDGAIAAVLNGNFDEKSHSMMQNFSAIPEHVPVLRRSFVSDEEYYKSRMYLETSAPWGFHSDGVIILNKGLFGGTVCGFLKLPGQDEVDAETLSLMAVFSRHLWRAMGLQQRIDKLEESLILTSGVLDLINFGLVLYNGPGAPVFINQSARRTLDSKDGLELDRNGLGIQDRAARQKFEDLLSALNHDDIPLSARSGGIVAVPRPSRKRPYSVMVVPMKGQSRSKLDNVKIAVFVFDPSAKTTTAIKLFISSYGLTRSEALLAQELAQGVSLDGFAAKHDISRNTAKTHLRSIFAKTETSRQPELVSLLLRSVAGINLKN